MYHEIEMAGRPLCHSEPGYVRYVVSEQDFRGQISWLREQNLRGLSVEQALAQPTPDGVVLTFDDGCATDLLVAAPLLADAGFGATFYITVGFLGQSGYLTAEQVRALSDAGFDIGCHSMTHPYLSDLSRSQLEYEIRQAKIEVESIIGKPVAHFSCPGGRWNRLTEEVARASGYQSVSSSRIGTNDQTTNPFNLARVAVTRSLPLARYQSICRGEGLWRLRLRDLSRSAAKQVLGNRVYDRLRARALEP